MSDPGSDAPLMLDIERDADIFDSPPPSPYYKEYKEYKEYRGHHRRKSSWSSYRLGLHPARRYFGTLLLAIVCFVIGFTAHQPKTIRVIRSRLATHGLVNHVVEAPARTDHINKAMRVRVLNELLKERYPAGTWTPVRRNNFPALERLASCLETNSCGPGEETLVVLASFRFALAEEGGTSGEEVWARSSMTAFRELNHTMVHTWGHMETLMIYQHLPDMIPVILWEQGEWNRCQQRNETNYLDLEKQDVESPGPWQRGQKGCMQTEQFPEGIPWWKSFEFLFWAQHDHPLGGNWVVAPEDYTYIRQNDEEHNYLGYSIESRCLNVPYFKEREQRALVLAKNDEYFDQEHNFFHNHLAEARDMVNTMDIDGSSPKFELLSTSGDEVPVGQVGKTIEPGITTIGRQKQDKWYEILAQSKVLLGIGRPQLSPSPYDALCLGVPFINPITKWDENDPYNRVKWETQADGLKYTEEPYVYHVFAGDTEGLAGALHRAVNNPIDRYIPENMRMETIIARHDALVRKDWHKEAVEWVHKTHGADAEHYKHLMMPMPALDVRGYFHNNEKK